MEMRYTLPEPCTQLRRVSFAAANDILSSGLVTSFHFHMFQAICFLMLFFVPKETLGTLL